MSAKPTIALARFADTGGADKTAPSSGLRDTGFVEGTPADQSIVNELLFQLYSWALYLNDGDLIINSITAPGPGPFITVVDAVIFESGINTNGGINLPTNHGITANGTTHWLVGDTAHNSSIELDGKMVLVGNLNLVGGDVRGVLRHLYSALSVGSPITGTVNDWNPSDLSGDDASIIFEIFGVSSPKITGLVGGVNGRVVTLSNSGSNSIVLAHDSGSTAANRFFWPTLADLTLATHQTVTIWYSTGASRWKLLSKNF